MDKSLLLVILDIFLHNNLNLLLEQAVRLYSFTTEDEDALEKWIRSEI